MASEGKHTPGPWAVEGTNVSDSRGDLICDVLGWDDSDMEQANARLIAAAPDLLAALRRIQAGYNAGQEGLTSGDKLTVDEAIARAEGRFSPSGATLMSNQEFVAKGGTKFERDSARPDLVHCSTEHGPTLTVWLTDLQEFVRSVEGQEQNDCPRCVTYKSLNLSRRTEVLGMMAATLLASNESGGLGAVAVVKDAIRLLAAVEEAERSQP